MTQLAFPLPAPKRARMPAITDLLPHLRVKRAQAVLALKLHQEATDFTTKNKIAEAMFCLNQNRRGHSVLAA